MTHHRKSRVARGRSTWMVGILLALVFAVSIGSAAYARLSGGSPNAIANSSFENGTGGWTGWNSTISSVHLSHAPTGTHVAKVNRSTGTAFSINSLPIVSSTTVGVTYNASVEVARASSYSRGKPVQLVIRQRDVTGHIVGEAASVMVGLTSTFATLSATYTTVETGGTLDVYVIQFNAAPRNAFYVANAVLTAPMLSPSPTPTVAPTPSSTPTPTLAAAPGPMQPFGGPPGVAWSLKFDDEFNGTSLDTSRWVALNGWHNNNVTSTPNDCSASGGHLVLSLPGDGTGCQVSSGPRDGAGANGYVLPVGGYVEFRAYFPGSGSGPTDSGCYNWPTLWTPGPNWPAAGETDVAEVLGGSVTVNYHSPSGAHNTGSPSGLWCNSWHTYGEYRGEHEVEVYYDGVLVRTIPTDDNGEPQSIWLTSGDSSGGPIQYGPAGDVLVDYVRAWTLPTIIETPPLSSGGFPTS